MLPTAAHVYLGTLAKLPPVPSTTPLYKGISSTTTNQDTSTFTGVDIGVPHPKRVVILAVHVGVAAAATASINGKACEMRVQNTAHEFAIFSVELPNGTLGDITVTAASSIRKEVAVYVAYPKNPMPIDSGTATANTTTNANVADMKVQAGGFLIFCGGQHATLGAFTATWNGAGSESVTEDSDAQYESASSFITGRITTILRSDDLGDVDLAETVSGTKRLVVATWGPA